MTEVCDPSSNLRKNWYKILFEALKLRKNPRKGPWIFTDYVTTVHLPTTLRHYPKSWRKPRALNPQLYEEY